jgi:hypothetical protein
MGPFDSPNAIQPSSAVKEFCELCELCVPLAALNFHFDFLAVAGVAVGRRCDLAKQDRRTSFPAAQRNLRNQCNPVAE